MCPAKWHGAMYLDSRIIFFFFCNPYCPEYAQIMLFENLNVGPWEESTGWITKEKTDN